MADHQQMPNCAYCGEPIIRRPGRSPAEVRKYCDHDCYWNALRARPRPPCKSCGKPIPGNLHKARKYCDLRCMGRAYRKTEKTCVTYDKSSGCWVGRLQINGAMQHRVTGSTRAEIVLKLKMLASGAQRLRRPERWISPQTVRDALDLLLPLDHDYRFERQTEAVRLLQEALRSAELGLVVSDAATTNHAGPATQANRSRPAWLDALPLRGSA